jgi:hypothetical protein
LKLRLAANHPGFGSAPNYLQSKAVTTPGTHELIEAMDSGRVAISPSAVRKFFLLGRSAFPTSRLSYKQNIDNEPNIRPAAHITPKEGKCPHYTTKRLSWPGSSRALPTTMRL